MKISDSVRYAGVNDHKVDLFEGQYDVPNGMAYNSYVIMDEKSVVMDTVDQNFTDEWLISLFPIWSRIIRQIFLISLRNIRKQQWWVMPRPLI